MDGGKEMMEGIRSSTSGCDFGGQQQLRMEASVVHIVYQKYKIEVRTLQKMYYTRTDTSTPLPDIVSIYSHKNPLIQNSALCKPIPFIQVDLPETSPGPLA